MTIDVTLRDFILRATPNLRAFAISLTNNVDRADDLVQETLMRAIANIHRFQPGTNMQAWLFTILRNLFHSEYRKRRREVEDADGKYAAGLAVQPDQMPHLDFEDLQKALARLPHDQREALLLVGPPASPTSRPPISAAAPWGPSRAGSTAPGTGLRSSCS
jgi:RNA polymerase sigma-70 factor, ECF subfamily